MLLSLAHWAASPASSPCSPPPSAGYTWLAILAVLNSVVSLAYHARVLGPGYFEPAPGPVPVLGPSAAVATGGAVLATVATGVVAEPLLRTFTDALLLPRP